MKDVERLNAWEQDRQRRLEAKRFEQLSMPEDEELRFRPSINKVEGDKPRTKEQFIAD